MIDSDWEETAPEDLEHQLLWYRGWGRVRRDDVLGVLRRLQHRQRIAGIPTLGIIGFCDFLDGLGARLGPK